ncbi:MAG: hypothetical protein KTR32_33190, partial [Granulosicoccus sp.]|nr:hypothetical protein [Granulosicoccus sp.]
MRRRYVVIVLIGTLTAVVLNVLLYRQSDAIFSTLNELSESLKKKERERFEVQLFLTQLHKSNSVQQTFENFQKSTFFVNRQQEITDPTLLDNWPEYHTLKQSNQTIDDLRADFLHTVNRSGQASFAATDFVAWGGQAIRVLETHQQLQITLRHYLKKLNEEQLLKVVSYNVVALLTLLIL